MRIKKSLKPRIPTSLAAAAAVSLAVTLLFSSGGESLQGSVEKFEMFGAKQTVSSDSQGSDSFRSALFLFRLR